MNMKIETLSTTELVISSKTLWKWSHVEMEAFPVLAVPSFFFFISEKSGHRKPLLQQCE